MKRFITDTVIIGGGLAGIYTALNIKNSHQITIVIKEPLGISNSNLAQGGIAAEIAGDEVALKKHIEDTLTAGVGLFDEAAIKELVYDAKKNMDFLINAGVPFDLDENGQIMFTKEGGHSTRRILHAGGDATGHQIMKALIALTLKKPNITILSQYMLTDILHDNNVCYGVRVIGQSGDIINVYANHTVLATGGIGAIYKDSTNVHGATGDGIAAAYRAKVTITNMEFVQFHPTVFYDVLNQTKGQKFLISEAVRGEGAYLLNVETERFMNKYDKRLELAPRDIVSQSIMKEMYDTWSEYVYIDARHLGKEFLTKRFPTIYERCLQNGYKMDEDLIPVAPVEHYGIGGIKINLDGLTSMQNLYASGECCNSGVHGANRLASNSLLECLVFSKRIADNVNKTPCKEPVIKTFTYNFHIKNYSYHSIRDDIRAAMNNYVFIVRTKEGLEMAQKIIDHHYQNLCKYAFTTVEYFRTLNITTVAKLIVEAAIARKESIGCHYRID